MLAFLEHRAACGAVHSSCDRLGERVWRVLTPFACARSHPHLSVHMCKYVRACIPACIVCRAC